MYILVLLNLYETNSPIPIAIGIGNSVPIINNAKMQDVLDLDIKLTKKCNYIHIGLVW